MKKYKDIYKTENILINTWNDKQVIKYGAKSFISRTDSYFKNMTFFWNEKCRYFENNRISATLEFLIETKEIANCISAYTTTSNFVIRFSLIKLKWNKTQFKILPE